MGIVFGFPFHLFPAREARRIRKKEGIQQHTDTVTATH